jgi:hypothetical protein
MALDAVKNFAKVTLSAGYAVLLVYGGQDIIIPAAQGVLMATKLNLQTGKDFFALHYGHGLAKEKETQLIILKWLENKG